MRAARRSSPAVVPPPAGTVFDPPPVPEFVRTLKFCCGGGEVLRLVLSSIGSGIDRLSKRKTTAPPGGSPGSKGKAKSSLPQAGRMFARTGKYNWSPCKFLYEPPAASACSPSPPARRDEGGGSVAAASGGSRVLSLRAVLPRGATGGATGVETLVLVLVEDTGPTARWGQPLRAQLRRRRWGKRLRQQLRVAAACWIHPRGARLRRWRLVGRLRERSRLAER